MGRGWRTTQYRIKQFGFLILAVLLPLAATQSSHTVVSGDTLSGIARQYQTNIETLMQINSLSDTSLQVGQVLAVPQADTSQQLEVAVETSAIRGIIVYSASSNDSLRSLAATYSLSLDTLRNANQQFLHADPDLPLVAGLTVIIPPGEGRVLIVQNGQNLLSVALNNDLRPTELASYNPHLNTQINAGDLIFIPQRNPFLASVAQETLTAREHHTELQESLLQQTASILAGFEPSISSDNFIWPLSSGRLTSYFGRRNISVGGNTFHAGIDIAAPTGTPIQSSRAGTVTRSGWGGGYGYVVYVDHPDGSQTRYAHMSQIAAQLGQSVLQGDVLGYVGSTGASTGPHLHFEIRFNGHAVDPLAYLQR